MKVEFDECSELLRQSRAFENFGMSLTSSSQHCRNREG